VFRLFFCDVGMQGSIREWRVWDPSQITLVGRGWNSSSPFTTLPIAHLEQATGGKAILINSGQLPPYLSRSFSTFSQTTVTTTQLNQSLNQTNQQSWDGSMMVGLCCTIPLNQTSLIASLDSQQAQYHDQATNRPHEAEWSHE
jgi:hypothetical protein